jgi:hypothetical protein
VVDTVVVAEAEVLTGAVAAEEAIINSVVIAIASVIDFLFFGYLLMHPFIDALIL